MNDSPNTSIVQTKDDLLAQLLARRATFVKDDDGKFQLYQIGWAPPCFPARLRDECTNNIDVDDLSEAVEDDGDHVNREKRAATIALAAATYGIETLLGIVEFHSTGGHGFIPSIPPVEVPSKDLARWIYIRFPFLERIALGKKTRAFFDCAMKLLARYEPRARLADLREQFDRVCAIAFNDRNLLAAEPERQCDTIAVRFPKFAEETRQFIHDACELAAEVWPDSEEASVTEVHDLTPQGDIDLTPQGDIDEASMSRDGDGWSITWSGGTHRYANSKGLQYISRLLAQRNVNIPCVQLANEFRPQEIQRAATGGQPAADQRYIKSLQVEIEDAKSMGNDEKVASLQSVLSKVVGRGSVRSLGSNIEQDRKNVSKAIRGAIAKIAASQPALGSHLRLSIHTGKQVSYRPTDDTPAWIVTE